MNKTLRISYSLRNTYRVNGILYSLKQIPVIKLLLPDTLYRVRGLKILANVLSGLWEFLSVFLGKALYFAVMFLAASSIYETVPASALFVHLLLILTVIGAFVNTYMFNPTRDKYYAMILMRMDARAYTLTNYAFAIAKVIVGFFPSAIVFGLLSGVPLWICLLTPFFVAGLKVVVSALTLLRYEKTGKATNENMLGKFGWIALLLLLGAAYGLPAAGIVIPWYVAAAAMPVAILAGLVSIRKLLRFSQYHAMYQQLLSQSMHQMDTAQKAAREQVAKAISADTRITSRRRGFEYFNDLFVKRHQKILWKSSKRIALVCLCLVLGSLLALYLAPEAKQPVNELLMTYLPYFVFIMYAINRGTGFTRALFINCDHSLLTYSFYKQPRQVLRLFQIRLREIVKVNLLPAAVIGGGLAVLLFASGGTENPLNYAVLLVSILCMSVFFSVHYLTIYYLLQPYNAGTEMKSGTYRLVLSVTYLVCFLLMQVQLPTLAFGLATIVFCVLYCVVASILVYRFAPTTFRLRT